MASQTRQIKIGEKLEELLYCLVKPIIIYPEGNKNPMYSNFASILEERLQQYLYNYHRKGISTNKEVLNYLESIPKNMEYTAKDKIKSYIFFYEARREFMTYESPLAFEKLEVILAPDKFRIVKKRSVVLSKEAGIKVNSWYSHYNILRKKIWKVQDEEYKKMFSENNQNLVLNFPPIVKEVALVRCKKIKII